MRYYNLLVVAALFLGGCSNKYLVEGHKWEGMTFSMSKPFIAFDHHTWYDGDDIPAVAKGYVGMPVRVRNTFCGFATNGEVEHIKDVVIIPAGEELAVRGYYNKAESYIPIGVLALATYKDAQTKILIERSDGFQFFVDNYDFETWAVGMKSSWRHKGKGDKRDPFYGFYAEKKGFVKIKRLDTIEKQKTLMSILNEKGGVSIDKGEYIEVDRQALANYYVKGCHKGLVRPKIDWNKDGWSEVVYSPEN